MWGGRGPTRSIPLEGLHSTSLEAFLGEDLPGLSNRDRSISVSEVINVEDDNVKTFDITFISSNHSYAGCHTSLELNANGTAPPGTPCSFPFLFNGKVYHYCTTDTHRNQISWCSTDPVYEGNWGECVCNDLNEVPLLEVDLNDTTLENITANVEVIVPATKISGKFDMIMDNTMQNVSLSWNATEQDMKDALETLTSRNFRGDSVPLLVNNVVRTQAPTAEGGYTWTVTFASSTTSYDVPSLSLSYETLTGHGVQAAAETLRNGASPIGSSFRLSFGTEGPSTEINYNASAEDLKSALENLPTVGNVFVTRDIIDASRNQFVWTVRFISTYTEQTYGFVQDENRNLPALEASTDNLSGTDAQIYIETLQQREIHMAPGLTQMGSPGLSAGAVYVLRSNLRNDTNEWIQSNVLVPNVTDGADMFGRSVCTDGESLVAIGAPSTQAVPELDIRSMYEIRCSAETGTCRM